MYSNFFGLQTKPFSPTPDPEFLYLSRGHKQALGSIIYGVRDRKGFIAVTGQVGLGKTTILRAFLAQNNPATQHAIYLLNPNLSFSSLLKTLLNELGHDPKNGDDAEVVEQLHMVLIEEYQKGKTIVLLIDEAQNMPIATLEHLRMLSNLETPKDKLLQIVLLGQPELDSLLDRYELRQVRQRIAVRAMIRPLSEQESYQYIQHRLDIAGGRGKKIFSRGALRHIVREAEGIPRRLNILCDNALVTALGYQKVTVSARIAKEVIRDLSSQPSRSLWKLVPLAAGVLIILIALATFIPLTPSTDPLPSVLQKNPEPVGDSAKKKPDTLDIAYAEKPLSDSQGSTPVVSEVSSEPVASETPTHIIPPNEKEVHGLLGQGDGVSTDMAVLPIPVKEPLLAQSESEARSEDPKETTDFKANPENLDEELVQVVMDLTGLESRPKEDSLPPTPMEKNPGTLQEALNTKPHVTKSSLPITKTMKEGDTLAELIQQVYGSVSPSTLRLVLDHNRHIGNVRRIFPGQKILFPPLNNDEPQKRPVKASTTLVSRKGEKLSPPKKVFTQSSTPTKKKQAKNRVKRNPPFAVAVVQKGDTLDKLVRAVYGSSDPIYIQRVLDYNPKILNAKRIFPGQDIAFPRIVEEMNIQGKKSFQGKSPE